MPKQDLAKLIEAFDRLAAADFTMGAEWQAVHESCQRHQGEQPFDWGHALCHRIEKEYPVHVDNHSALPTNIMVKTVLID